MPSPRIARLSNRLRLLGQMSGTEEDLEQEARVALWQGKSPQREALRWWKQNGRTIRLPSWVHDAGRWDEYPDADSLDMRLENAKATGNRRGLEAIAVDGVEDEAIGMAFWAGVLKRAKLSERQFGCLRAFMMGESQKRRADAYALIVARQKIRRVLAGIQAEERALLGESRG